MFSFFKKFLQKDTSKSQHIPKEKSLSDYNITMSIYTPLEIDSIYQKTMECGLLPGEIVLLGWLENKSATREYPRYYSSTYDIDAFKKTQKLIEEGYIRGASPKEGLLLLCSIDLSKILERNGIKKTGKKQDLIDRICNSLTLEEIEECIESKVYVVTDKGKSTLEKHYYGMATQNQAVFIRSASSDLYIGN